MEKLWIDNKKFVTREELKKILKGLNKEYLSTIRYLISQRYIARIFRGIFYVKSLEEIKLGKIEKSFFEIIAEGLSLKDVKNWYFGAETALRLNKLTHEYFTINTIINDKIFRQKPIKIMNYKIKFIKINPKLIFGIKLENQIKFSDVEKTMLDFIYLGRYGDLNDTEIYNKIKELSKKCLREKIKKYIKKYPKSVKEFLIKRKIVKNL